MKKAAIFCLVTGLVLLTVGYFYFVKYVNIPPAYRTPDVAIAYKRHHIIANAMNTWGALFFIIGIVLTIINAGMNLFRRMRTRQGK